MLCTEDKERPLQTRAKILFSVLYCGRNLWGFWKQTGGTPNSNGRAMGRTVKNGVLGGK